ncbi:MULTISPECIES: hypothetical protein [Streptococcus]|uniref:hypothetical protein n=1 Tax=Streptococcus TaxID=1301 RepID=UPI000788871B|nr:MULTISPECIES: hypothetical protein [Streptococcus]
MGTIITQMAILIVFLLYILISISLKKFHGKIYRACTFIFIIAGMVSYVTKGSNWFDFLALLIPLMVLYQFEDRFTK